MQEATTGNPESAQLEHVVAMALRGQASVDATSGISFEPRPVRPAQPQEYLPLPSPCASDSSVSSSTADLATGGLFFIDFPIGVYALAKTTEGQNPTFSNSDAHDLEPRANQDCAANLYTPQWTRCKGTARQGWCGLCQPGRWLDLRNSEYWYDKLYRHGIDTNGDLLSRPQNVRKTVSNRGWECLCATCNKWITLKRGEASWFRHVYEVSLFYIHTIPRANIDSVAAANLRARKYLISTPSQT